MSLPNETDLPDPPLDNSGELQLPPELVGMADRLRRESVVVAEASVPQAAAVPLLRYAADGGKRQTWRHIALGAAALTFCASLLVIISFLRHAAELARPLPNGSRPIVIRPATGDEQETQQPYTSLNAFVSSDGTNFSSALDTQLAIAADALTPEQRIELLEHTVDVYRDALTAHRERILELQRELEQAQSQLDEQ